jgi:hypothetical protein
VSLTASFWGSEVRKKIIRGKSKIYKNSQNAIKIKKSPHYLQKKGLVMRIGWKMHYLQPSFKDFDEPLSNFVRFLREWTTKLNMKQRSTWVHMERLRNRDLEWVDETTLLWDKNGCKLMVFTSLSMCLCDWVSGVFYSEWVASWVLYCF